MASEFTGTSRRLTASVCLVVAATLAAPPAVAHAKPKPNAAEARKKLIKLNEQVEDLVEKYNDLGEKLKVARKKLDAAKKSNREELKTFEERRRKIAEMAATAYKNGDNSDVTGFVAGDPQAVLDQAAVFSHLSRNRSSEISQFLDAAQRLRREQAQAQSAFDEVNNKAKDLKKQKAEVEQSIKKQKKLLEAAGEKPSSSNSGGGGNYTGPASGNARTALNFAYAQLGKPYIYGGTGPSGFDCSGLTMKAWGAAGVGITRTTNSQYAATKRIDKSALQPGDLVFFRSLGHVGLYVGGGQMIHAPRTGKNVEVVSITSGYYLSNYYGAGRP
ncbi:NlpC/P60 family protein [Spirillospora sp. CA-294931]|uniref:C40 family peptidase n=1 Tax=Spirillospora sp. CA-294931 TaxID=3240042 RepID=UPI003D9336D9